MLVSDHRQGRGRVGHTLLPTADNSIATGRSDSVDKILNKISEIWHQNGQPSDYQGETQHCFLQRCNFIICPTLDNMQISLVISCVLLCPGRKIFHVSRIDMRGEGEGGWLWGSLSNQQPPRTYQPPTLWWRGRHMCATINSCHSSDLIKCVAPPPIVRSFQLPPSCALPLIKASPSVFLSENQQPTNH